MALKSLLFVGLINKDKSKSIKALNGAFLLSSNIENVEPSLIFINNYKRAFKFIESPLFIFLISLFNGDKIVFLWPNLNTPLKRI